MNWAVHNKIPCFKLNKLPKIIHKNPDEIWIKDFFFFCQTYSILNFFGS